MIIPDNETEIDLLYYEAISKTILDLLASTSDVALTVGVHGDWGAGKSSILKMLESAYDENEDTLCIVFNGWLFQGFEDTKTVLIETIIENLIRERTLTGVVRDKAENLLKRVNWMKVARKMGGLAFTVVTGMPTRDQLKSIIDTAQGFVGKAGEYTGEDIEGFIAEAQGYLKESQPDTMPSQIHAFREEFAELLSEAKVERLIVIVDDLDRCLPETAIETLEAIRLFLFVPGAAFVIAADEAMIEYAVKKHFPDLPLSTGPASYAQNYLEKLIQVPFRLPPLGYIETRTYITLLRAELALGSDHEAFSILKDLAKGVLRKPWVGDGFGRDQIAKALGSIPAEVEHAIQLADQIAPILTDGARGNPRQIKRFLNAMSLRLAIAERRQIADDIAIDVLSKLMLAERFDTELYDRISRETNIDGKSSTLQRLETESIGGDSVAGDKSKTVPKAKKVRATVVSDVDEAGKPETQLSEWSRRWLGLEPKLGDIDLRPYLFISRDRKVLFSTGATLPQMEAWVEKLCGERLEAKAIAAEIGKLPPAEAERYFNAVLARVRGATALKLRPPGIYGLAEICKVHPTLQSAIIALFESFPQTELGVWVVTGWVEVFTTSDSAARFKVLREAWAAQDENKLLKTAAATTLKQASR